MQAAQERGLAKQTLQKLNDQLQQTLRAMATEKHTLLGCSEALQEQFEVVEQAIYEDDDDSLGKRFCVLHHVRSLTIWQPLQCPAATLTFW